YNISFKFVKTNSTYYIEEVSDRSVYVDGYNKSVTTSRPEGVYSDGYLKLDPAKSMIAGLSGSGYFVAVKKSSTEVELYNPFTPNKVYTFKR
ncbi:MAG: hypothetical protein K2N28_02625, partial [Muribaculaceae bacterium]|nr:hypothetical protein [Muribaculaceae bacterium]